MPVASSVTVLYHADCIDGFGAAYAAWCYLGSNAIYRPLHHGEAWDTAEITGHNVFILDFSFAPNALKAMAGLANSVIQIDHHLSALQAWGDRLQADENGFAGYADPDLPLTVIFDLEKSGARLAWEHFQADQPIPLVLQHIEDQDMWRFALPGTRAFCRALRLLPFDLSIWHELVRQTWSSESPRYRETLAKGEAVEEFFRKEVDRLASGHLRIPAHLRGEPVDAMQALRHGQATVTDGEQSWLAISGVAINASVLFASELGNLLAEQSASFGLIWQLANDGEVKVSLRSKGSFDVAAIALRYGGGGHRNAAGFRIPLQQFMTEVLGQFSEFSRVAQPG
ncbi:MAG: DHHA1 domain-containing protein [Azonexus sp.]|nr:DHHA1 domain-containing protein [Azonexus sp.]